MISRYDRIGGYDWIAIPLIPYLYAVTEPEGIPVYADSKIVAFLRDRYRREHMQELVPDRSLWSRAGWGWVQLVGSTYNRTSFAYEIDTTAQQDDELIVWLNSVRIMLHTDSYRAIARTLSETS